MIGHGSDHLTGRDPVTQAKPEIGCPYMTNRSKNSNETIIGFEKNEFPPPWDIKLVISGMPTIKYLLRQPLSV